MTMTFPAGYRNKLDVVLLGDCSVQQQDQAPHAPLAGVTPQPQQKLSEAPRIEAQSYPVKRFFTAQASIGEIQAGSAGQTGKTAR